MLVFGFIALFHRLRVPAVSSSSSFESSLKIVLESLLPGDGPSSNEVRLVLLDPPSSCPSPWSSTGSTGSVHGRPSVTSMSGIMILGVFKHQTRGDKPGRAPPVPPCLELAAGDFGLRPWPAARHQTICWVRPVVSDPAGRNPCQVGLAEGQRRRGAVQPSH